MPALDSLDNLPPWALYGGAAAVAGGGYLLYRRHKAAAAVAATSGTTSTSSQPTGTPGLFPGNDGMQGSIVPYYLTDQSASMSGGPRRTTPQPVPTTVIGNGTGAATGTDSGTPGATLPDIPPLLPISPTPPPAPAPPAPTQAAPTPAPAAQNNNIPPDLMQRIIANGEHIIGALPSPNGGVWYLGSKGGVFAINAPFYGAPAGQSYWGARTPATILPSGSGGYQVIDTAGEKYAYGG